MTEVTMKQETKGPTYRIPTASRRSWGRCVAPHAGRAHPTSQNKIYKHDPSRHDKFSDNNNDDDNYDKYFV